MHDLSITGQKKTESIAARICKPNDMNAKTSFTSIPFSMNKLIDSILLTVRQLKRSPQTEKRKQVSVYGRVIEIV